MDVATLRRLQTLTPTGNRSPNELLAEKYLDPNSEMNANKNELAEQHAPIYLIMPDEMKNTLRGSLGNSRGDEMRKLKVVPGGADRVPTLDGNNYVEAPLMNKNEWNQSVESNAQALDRTPYPIGDLPAWKKYQVPSNIKLYPK